MAAFTLQIVRAPEDEEDKDEEDKDEEEDSLRPSQPFDDIQHSNLPITRRP
jgi:hypothetical protein